MRTNIIRGFISIFGSKIAVLLLSIATTPILVRLLGSGRYGDYAFLLSILGVSMIIVNAGIFDGIRKYIAESREFPNWTEYVFSFYFLVAILLAVTGALIYVILSWSGLLVSILSEDFRVYFYLIALLIVGRQAYSVARGSLMGLGLESRSEPLNILKKILFVGLALSLVYAGYGIVGVLVGHIVATTIVSIVAYAILAQHIDYRSLAVRTPVGFPKRELLSFNGLSIILILLTASLYHVDILFLRLLVGDQSTGYYKAALVIAEFLWFVPNALQTVLLHSSSELWSNDQTDHISSLASKITRYNMSFTLLLVIGLAALASDFIPLYYGSEFDTAVLPLLLLLPGALGFALARPIFAIGQGKGQLRVLIIATGAASIINLSLNTLLIPPYGMIGAAMATSIGYGSMLLFHVLAARKIGFSPTSNLRIKRLIIVGTSSAVVIFGLSSIIRDSIVSMILVPPIGFAVYTLLTVRLSVISSAEIITLTQNLPSPVQSQIKRIMSMVD